MNISQTETRGFTVLRIEGKFDTNTAPMVRDTLQRLTGAGVQRILIDFEEVDYMSSIGLQLLLLTSNKLRASGGHLRLCSPNDTVTEVLRVSGFKGLFSVFPSQAEALEGF